MAEPATAAASSTRSRYRKASSPIGTMPSSDAPWANGTTTAMTAQAAVSAAVTAACAVSVGCRERDGRRAAGGLSAVTAQFCQVTGA